MGDISSSRWSVASCQKRQMQPWIYRDDTEEITKNLGAEGANSSTPDGVGYRNEQQVFRHRGCSSLRTT